MRYWVDVLTPKQILFFKPLVQELRQAGHEVLVTSRRYREVEQLASLTRFEMRYYGQRGGKDPLDQFKASLQRMEALLPEVSGFSPAASISVASADCARISFGLRIKHIAVNDSPHSLVAGKLSLTLSHHLFCPWIIPYSAWARFGLSKTDITRYKALDPAVWLKRQLPPLPADLKLDRSLPTILVRLEESYAPYMIGSDESWPERVLTLLAREFRDCNLVALCRYQEQLDQVKAKFGGSYIIPDGAVDGAWLLRESDVFVGMGGTMTTEAALLGVPAVSAFQGGSLWTERFLASKNLLLRARSPQTLVKTVKRSLDPVYHRTYARRAKVLLASMEDPIARITRFLQRDIPGHDKI